MSYNQERYFHLYFQYLGSVEVFDSRGMQVCEEAIKVLKVRISTMRIIFLSRKTCLYVKSAQIYEVFIHLIFRDPNEKLLGHYFTLVAMVLK